MSINKLAVIYKCVFSPQPSPGTLTNSQCLLQPLGTIPRSGTSTSTPLSLMCLTMLAVPQCAACMMVLVTSSTRLAQTAMLADLTTLWGECSLRLMPLSTCCLAHTVRTVFKPFLNPNFNSMSFWSDLVQDYLDTIFNTYSSIADNWRPYIHQTE